MGKKTRLNVRDRVREQLTAMLTECEDLEPWQMPWRSLNKPYNALTSTPYKGINVFLLTLRAWQLGVTGGAWLTFRQAKKLGGSVKPGEKSITCVYYNMVKAKTDDASEDEEDEFYPLLKHFQLFHTSQCEGIDFEEPELVEDQEVTDVPEELSALFDASPIPCIDGDKASYSSTLDRIQMPPIEHFYRSQDWWRVWLHELTHATGHASRLNRKLANRFGSRDYAFEELVAELGAAMLGMRFGLTSAGEPDEMAKEHANQHAAYLKSWLTELEQDERFIFDAWALACEACDWIEALITQEEDNSAAA